MAKKTITPPEDDFNADIHEMEAEATSLSGMDFDLVDEFKPEPIIPNGNYLGSVVEVKAYPNKYSIGFKVCFNDNEVTMSDGETPVDGSHLVYNLWLPKPGDDKAMQASGRKSKRQGKIDMMNQFARDMGLEMENFRNGKAIEESIDNGIWIGIPVTCKVEIEESEMFGVRNRINRMKRVQE